MVPADAARPPAARNARPLDPQHPPQNKDAQAIARTAPDFSTSTPRSATSIGTAANPSMARPMTCGTSLFTGLITGMPNQAGHRSWLSPPPTG